MRKAQVKRSTKETSITIELGLDGEGTSNIDSKIPFFDHMLTLFAGHGLFDLSIACKGDVAVDYHHTVEDVGISLGQAFSKALETGSQIVRFADCLMPMDETLCQVALDISGRPYLAFNVPVICLESRSFDTLLVREFLRGFITSFKINLHVRLLCGEEPHHVCEAIFKGVGRAVRLATRIDERRKGIPSTKGTLL